MKGKRKALSLTQGKGKKLDTDGRGKNRKMLEHRAQSLDDWEPYPYEPTEEDFTLFDSMAHVSPHAPSYLLAYARTGLNTEACRRIGISDSLPRYWKRRHPDFADLIKDLKEGVRDRWTAVGQRKALEGFRDEMYNADGDLVGVKIREDPGFLKATLGAVDPDRWGKARDTGQIININIVDVNE